MSAFRTVALCNQMARWHGFVEIPEDVMGMPDVIVWNGSVYWPQTAAGIKPPTGAHYVYCECFAYRAGVNPKETA